eukprot:5773-Heterococcus_DN1.PRE.1
MVEHQDGRVDTLLAIISTAVSAYQKPRYYAVSAAADVVQKAPTYAVLCIRAGSVEAYQHALALVLVRVNGFFFPTFDAAHVLQSAITQLVLSSVAANTGVHARLHVEGCCPCQVPQHSIMIRQWYCAKVRHRPGSSIHKKAMNMTH